MNSQMKGLMNYKKRSSILLCILSVVGILFGLLLVSASGPSEEARPEPVDFSGMEEDGDQYCCLEVAYLSDSIANYTSNERHQICLAEDMRGYPYVVCLDQKELDEHRDMVDYTYGYSEIDPGLVKLYGYPVEMDDELKEYVAEQGNIFWGTDFLTEDNVEEYFGNCLLDTTRKGAGRDQAMASCGGIFVLLFVLLLLGTILKQSERGRRTKYTVNRENASYDIEQIGMQILSDSASCYRQSNTYITSQYAASGKYGFDYISFDRCTQIRREHFKDGVKSRTALVFTDQEGGRHRMLVMKNNPAAQETHQSVVRNILARYPDVVYAGEYTSAAWDSADGGQQTIRSGGRVLGIIGAVLGALAGAVFWVLIGELGFIAGVAGLVMVMLAMKGYRLLAGGIDRAGAITAIVIAFILIIPANLASNVWVIYKAFGYEGAGGVTLGDIIGNLSYYMTEYEQWGSFAANLAVGYLLSLWSSWSTIRENVRKK